MGASIGKNFKDLDGNEFHLEAKDRGIAIWTKDEMHRILFLSKTAANELVTDLMLYLALLI